MVMQITEQLFRVNTNATTGNITIALTTMHCYWPDNGNGTTLTITSTGGAII